MIDIEAAYFAPPMYHNLDHVISHSLEYKVIHADQFAPTDKSKHNRCEERFSCVANVPSVVLTEMYHTLTSDCTAVPNPEITNRLRQFMMLIITTCLILQLLSI